MNIGDVCLEDLPHIPQSYIDAHSDKRNLSPNEQREKDIFDSNREKIIKDNSLSLFGRDYQLGKRVFDKIPCADSVGYGCIDVLHREFNRTGNSGIGGRRLLQIGCGPSPPHVNGPLISRVLQGMGAKVYNIDILDVAKHYDAFEQSSWFNIESVFGNALFDAIFVERMTDELGVPGDSFWHRRGSRALITKTVSKLEEGGLFFVSGANSNNFRFSWNANIGLPDNVEHNEIYVVNPYNKVQLYRKTK